MSLKDWKNNELSTLLTEKWGFSFNLLAESQEEEVVEESADEDTLNEEEEDEIEEGAASSGRVVTSDRGGEDRRAGDERKRPMEEAEEKGKHDDGDGKDEKCDHIPCKDEDRVNEQDDEHNLRQKKHMQGKKEKEKVDVPMPSEKEFDSQLKRTRKRQKMTEAKIRNLIHKLIKEAMAKKVK